MRPGRGCTADSVAPFIVLFVSVITRVPPGSFGEHPALWRAGVRVRHRPVFQHARVEPLADQAKQHSVLHPFAKGTGTISLPVPRRTDDVRVVLPFTSPAGAAAMGRNKTCFPAGAARWACCAGTGAAARSVPLAVRWGDWLGPVAIGLAALVLLLRADLNRCA